MILGRAGWYREPIWRLTGRKARRAERRPVTTHIGLGPIGEVLGFIFGDGLSRLLPKNLCDRGSLWAWHGLEAFPVQRFEHAKPRASRLSERSCCNDLQASTCVRATQRGMQRPSVSALLQHPQG